MGLGMGMGTPMMSSPALGAVSQLGGSPQLQHQQLLMQQQPIMSTPMLMNTMASPLQAPPQLVNYPISMGSPLMTNSQLHMVQTSPAHSARSSPHLTATTTGGGGGGVGPTDTELASKIHQLLTGVDLMTVTKKKIRQQLEAIYGVDFTPRRDFISRTIDAELQSKSGGASGATSAPPL